MNSVDMLHHALDSDAGNPPQAVGALVGVALEVAAALTSPRLSRREHEHIYARSLAMLEEAVSENRRGWQRALHLESPRPVLVGGAAALTLGAAAIAWAVLHGRRSPAPLAA